MWPSLRRSVARAHLRSPTLPFTRFLRATHSSSVSESLSKEQEENYREFRLRFGEQFTELPSVEDYEERVLRKRKQGSGEKVSLMDSIIKVFVVKSAPNYMLPWQNKALKEVTGSGFVIQGRRLLTNAHVVADQKYVMVRKLGSAKRFEARVEAAGHECDLALLSVADESFWDGLEPLEFGEIPHLQNNVVVVGYPIGGDNVSVTTGVVSRIEPQNYVHGGTANLLAIQIDAAINPGNSGGPAFQDDKVIGVAFQNLTGANNIGFIIPKPIVDHFLNDVQLNGKYTGFCNLGIHCQAMENAYLQTYMKLKSHQSGVLINKVQPVSPSAGVLQKNDVVVEIDGHAVACDGTVPFRGRERIGFDYLVSKKYAGDTMNVSVVRDGELLSQQITLKPLQTLVPIYQYDRQPSYYIFAGLVFVPLTQAFLHEYGRNWYSSAPRELVDRAINGELKQEGEQVVVLSQILTDDVNVGYQGITELQVKKVNGEVILNLQHLKRLMEEAIARASPDNHTLVLDLEDERLIVLDVLHAKRIHHTLLKRHRIPADRSPDLE